MQTILWEMLTSGKAFSWRFSLLLLVFSLGAAGAYGQSRRGYLRAGDEAFEQKNYGVALQHYMVALERKPDDAEALWKCAESARLIHSYPLAERMYRQLETDEAEKSKNPLTVARSEGAFILPGFSIIVFASINPLSISSPPANPYRS